VNPWVPAAPCGPACVAHAAPRVSIMDQAGRLAALAIALARAGRAAVGMASLADADRDRRIRTVATAVLDALGVRLEADTTPLKVPGPSGTLIVANHASWLDVVALLAVAPATVSIYKARWRSASLAKREVAGWPVLGALASAAGTRFVDRGGLRALPATVAELAGLLRAGRSVAVFPEATSWCGPPGGQFRRAPFQAALDAGAPVRPVTISYRQGGRPSTVAAFVGDDTVAASVSRVAAAGALAVRIEVQPAIWPSADRRELAARAQASVRSPDTEPAHV
jgi:1-acyl-sn-glycerol-3-phosphate acyltransferase